MEKREGKEGEERRERERYGEEKGKMREKGMIKREWMYR